VLGDIDKGEYVPSPELANEGLIPKPPGPEIIVDEKDDDILSSGESKSSW
jgi:hypothetical protein